MIGKRTISQQACRRSQHRPKCFNRTLNKNVWSTDKLSIDAGNSKQFAAAFKPKLSRNTDYNQELMTLKEVQR